MRRWFARPAPEPAGPRITLVDRVGCHLCDVAAGVVERVAERTGTAWERVDVDSSPELVEQYDELVPVVLVDGRQIAHWSVTEETLARALRRRRRDRRHTRQ
ncbi:glutaredoxin family protein [Ornithinimicrobium cavernae]|uniref:glutaredoxin family protein n=1 Tax=Ornithinimicrobium cavernae TaxID=2666047 RepID=UPI000D692060|nr:glutaredoxin family protein [Ornithinimicrobium cavernae]